MGESGTSTPRVRPSLLPLEAFPPRSVPLFASTALDALPSLRATNAFYYLLVPEIVPLDALNAQSGYGADANSFDRPRGLLFFQRSDSRLKFGDFNRAHMGRDQPHDLAGLMRR
jgi:hypothetical protein